MLGACAACRLSVDSHFTDGQWIGCTASVNAATVFTLVPILVPRSVFAESAPRKLRAKPSGKRQFARGAYRATLPPGGMAALPLLSPNRRRVLDAIVHLNTEEQIQPVTRDVIKKTDLSAGIVSEALVWLRAKALVVATQIEGEAAPE